MNKKSSKHLSLATALWDGVNKLYLDADLTNCSWALASIKYFYNSGKDNVLQIAC